MPNKKDIAAIVGSPVALSEPMAQAFELWRAMYENRSPWLGDEIKSLGLASSISSEIARMVTIEMQVKLDGGRRADWLASQIKPAITKLKNEKLELGLSRGGFVMKPYASNGKLFIDFIAQDGLYPLEFDSNGNITSVVFSYVQRVGDWWYTRLEYHQLQSNNLYLIQNYFYRSRDQNVLGSRVTNPDDLPTKWQNIEGNTGDNGTPVQLLANIAAPLYGYFRFPSPNNVDPYSPLGVACFSNAQNPNGGIELIKQADQLWSNLVWEFESGKRRIYVDTTAFEIDSNTGLPKLPDKNLYRTLNRTTNIGDKGNLFDAWTPEFREAAINNGLNAILKKIEFNCRLAYGTISDPQTVDRTATEILSSQQRSYVTVTSIQHALQSALDDTLYGMDVWTTLFKLAPQGKYSATYEWDDSVITNKDAQFMQDSQALSLGTMSKLEWRMRTYHEDEATARTMLALVDAERANEPSLFGGNVGA